MGPGNQAIWKLCGIMATKHGRSNVSCPHPCDKGRRLYFLADVPHLLKNLRGHLVRGQEIFLDNATVRNHNLPTAKVSLEHVKKMCELDEQHKLKLLPGLKLKDLNPNHFEKMDVASAVALLNHSVGAAIRYLVSLQKLLKEALTTAWFFKQVFRWFTLMTSPAMKTALSDFCPEKAHEAKVFMENFKEMFSLLVILDNLSKVARKPVQTGVLISTEAALHLRNQPLP
ncbi:uncharacterized protein LOC121835887 [Ixodes scapularis]|uniref:uncharacterized protein LOC121835887 n=1 Tax=Ixodes scapularis TaxID=6945 RepID=UPI001C383979|nr:uncharacterized protein LOC121835887 [Ixodes scapularis]